LQIAWQATVIKTKEIKQHPMSMAKKVAARIFPLAYLDSLIQVLPLKNIQTTCDVESFTKHLSFSLHPPKLATFSVEKKIIFFSYP